MASRSRPGWVAAALAGALLVSACGAGGGGVEQTEEGLDGVTVGLIPIIDVAPVYLGVDQGFFAEEGLELTIESGQGGAAIVPGVASGQFQFGFSNNTSLLLARSEGLDVRVVAAGNSTTGVVGEDFGAVVAPAGSAIASPADLAGRTVAVNTLNNIGSTTINKVVRDAGGDPTTISYVELGFPDMPAALAQGQVDAAWVVEPFLSITRSQGATPVAWNFAGTDPDLMIASYFTSDRFAGSDADLVERFTTAMNRSLDYASENPDAVRQILTTYTALDAAGAEGVTLPRWPTEIDTASFEVLADLAVQDGALEERPDIGALVP